MSIETQLEELNQIKTNIFTSIRNKGIVVPENSGLKDAAGLIDQIDTSVDVPKLYFNSNAQNIDDGWRFGKNACITSNAGKYSIVTDLGSYSKCPYINTAKIIYLKFKCNFGSIIHNYRLQDTNFEEGYRLFTIYFENSDYYLGANLMKGSTIYKSYSNLIQIALNKDYTFEHILDLENLNYQFKINNTVYINENDLDKSSMQLERFCPAWGIRPNYTTCYLPPKFTFYRNEVEYKIDGIEQIEKETLE